jgi:hypothetical protein
MFFSKNKAPWLHVAHATNHCARMLDASLGMCVYAHRLCRLEDLGSLFCSAWTGEQRKGGLAVWHIDGPIHVHVDLIMPNFGLGMRMHGSVENCPCVLPGSPSSDQTPLVVFCAPLLVAWLHPSSTLSSMREPLGLLCRHCWRLPA